MKIKKLCFFIMVLLVILSAVPISVAEEPTEMKCAALAENEIRCIPYKPRIDVVFVIDSTGSMADEIRTVKTHLIKIIKEVEGGQPRPYLRVGIVTYRDHKLEEPEYLYRKFELTHNIDKAVDFIRNIEARGGGDLPEAAADGLDAAINHMNWNNIVITQNQKIYPIPYPYTKKLIFLIGDAAPHGEGSTDQSYVQGCPHGHNYRQNIEDAVERGIRIYTVSGSGIDHIGIKIFKEIARKTDGSYTHLSYIRRNVQEYYEEEGFTPAEVKVYAEEAKEDTDYDKKTNSILTNTLGSFAKESVMAEAEEMGVEYDNSDDDSDNTNDDSNDWLDVDDITGDIVVEIDDEKTLRESLYGFLKRILSKILFWR